MYSQGRILKTRIFLQTVDILMHNWRTVILKIGYHFAKKRVFVLKL